MTQSNFNLPNTDGATFRSNNNTAHQAHATWSSGSTAPGTTYPYQVWIDTANGLLKRRNSANTAWITEAKIDGSNPSRYDASQNDYTPDFTGASTVNLRDELDRRALTPQMFGAVGDYSTDDTQAIKDWLSALDTEKREGFLPRGVYRIVDSGLTLPASVIIRGVGAPTMGTFPIQLDDKRFLRPGFKDQIPGSVLIFDGTGADTASMDRTDNFSSFSYAVTTVEEYPFRLSGIGIVMDMDVLDSGGSLTDHTADNRSDYDVGLYLDDCAGAWCDDVTVFGYWKRAGLLVGSNQTNASNPDFNRFDGGMFSGDYGVALLGKEGATGTGLSGTQFQGSLIFSRDHHTRDTDPGEYGSGAVLIDGDAGTVADLNGHYFYGGVIRTYVNNAIDLRKCSGVWMYGTVWELPPSGDANATGVADEKGEIRGVSGETGIVGLVGVRRNGENGLDDLRNNADEVIVVGDSLRGLAGSKKGGTARISANGSTGDPEFQMTTDSTSGSSDWVTSMDVSDNDKLIEKYDGTEVGSLTTDGLRSQNGIVVPPVVRTISSGAVDATGVGRIKVNGEGGANDNLTQLSGGVEGQRVLLSENANGDITVVDGTANIRLQGGTNFTLNSVKDRLYLEYDGSDWVEISQSNNV